MTFWEEDYILLTWFKSIWLLHRNLLILYSRLKPYLSTIKSRIKCTKNIKQTNFSPAQAHLTSQGVQMGANIQRKRRRKKIRDDKLNWSNTKYTNNNKNTQRKEKEKKNSLQNSLSKTSYLSETNFVQKKVWKKKNKNILVIFLAHNLTNLFFGKLFF